MYQTLLAVAFFTTLLAGGAANRAQADSKTIPLDQIWGYQMPGTRDVRELEPARNYDQLPSLEKLLSDSLVARVQHALMDRPAEGKQAGPAFVVQGSGKAALTNAARVLTGKEKRVETFPPDTDLTLVFFSYRCGQYVWLDSVERTPNRITIGYRFVTHRTRESTMHFALIPLGKLPKGTIQVEIKQLPPVSIDGDQIPTVPDLQRVVCGSFSFDVGENHEKTIRSAAGVRSGTV